MLLFQVVKYPQGASDLYPNNSRIHTSMKKTNTSNMQITVVPRMKTKAEIADEIGIHLSTLQRRLKQAGLTVPRGLITPEQQKEIYDKLGWGTTS